MKSWFQLLPVIGFLFLAGCYTVLRHEQVVIPAVDEETSDSENVGVSTTSECASCHEEEFTELDYAYHSASPVVGRYAMWLEYFENPEPWWVTVPPHEDQTYSGAGDDDDSSVRRNYGGRRTNLNTDNTITGSSGSSYTGNSGGNSVGSSSGGNSAQTSNTENSASTRNERPAREGSGRRTQSDDSQRDQSGSKTNKK
jgi:hypothetical protein